MSNSRKTERGAKRFLICFVARPTPFAILIALLCGALHAATYYVSNSGSDSNSGASPASPWKTIAHVNSQTRNPGDSVLFQAGGVWRTTTDAALTVEDMGAPGNPVTYGSYGTGNPPRISSSLPGTFTLSSGNIYVLSGIYDNPQVVTVNGAPGTSQTSEGALAANNQWYYNSSTYQIFIYESGGVSGLAIEYGANYQALYVYGSHVVIENLQFDGGFYNLIEVAANSTYPAPADITLTNLTLLNSWENCVNINNEESNTTTYVTVSNSTITSCGLNGINAQYANYLTFTGNTVSYSATQVGISGSTPLAGIHIFGRPAQVATVANNVIHHMGYNLAGTAVNTTNALGIHLDTVGYATTSAGLGLNNNVLNNTVHDNTQGDIQIEVSKYVTVAGNLLYNDYPGQPALILSTQDSFTTSDGNYENSDNLVQNNTIYNAQLAIQLNGAPSGRVNTCLNNTVQNNIFNPESTYKVMWAFDGCDNDGVQGTGNVYTYNYVGANQTNMFEWGSTEYSTLASWETASGNCGTAGCSHSLQSSPQFVNASAYDFFLDPGSPALTASLSGGTIGAFGVNFSISSPTSGASWTGWTGNTFSLIGAPPSTAKVCYTVDAYPAGNPGADPLAISGDMGSLYASGCSNTPPFSFPANTFWWANNSAHQVVATAYDALGNTLATSSPVSFAIANAWPVSCSGSAPQFSVSLPSQPWSGQVTVTPSVTGACSSDSITFSLYLDGVLKYAKSASSGTASMPLDTTQVDNSATGIQHTVAVTASDSTNESNYSGVLVATAGEQSEVVTLSNGTVPFEVRNTSSATGGGGRTLYLAPLATVTLTPELINTDGSVATGQTFCFVSATPSVATVSAGTPDCGTSTTVTGVAQGSAEIYVMDEQKSGTDLQLFGPAANNQFFSTSLGYWPDYAGRLITITGGTNCVVGTYYIDGVSLSGSDGVLSLRWPPENSSTAPILPSGSGPCDWTTGPTRVSWAQVNSTNAAIAHFSNVGSILTSYTPGSSIVFNEAFGSLAEAESQIYPVTYLTNWCNSGFNTLETGVILQEANTWGSNWTSQAAMLSSEVSYLTQQAGYAGSGPCKPYFWYTGDNLMRAGSDLYAISEGVTSARNGSTWTTSGIATVWQAIKNVNALGGVVAIGMTMVDEVPFGATPFQGPTTLGAATSRQNWLGTGATITASSGVCTVTGISTSGPVGSYSFYQPTIGFIVSGSSISGMNSIPGGSLYSLTAVNNTSFSYLCPSVANGTYGAGGTSDPNLRINTLTAAGWFTPPANIVYTTATAASGASTITVASATGPGTIATGATVTGNGIASSTTVTSVSGTSIGISNPTTSSLSATALTFTGAASDYTRDDAIAYMKSQINSIPNHIPSAPSIAGDDPAYAASCYNGGVNSYCGQFLTEAGTAYYALGDFDDQYYTHATGCEVFLGLHSQLNGYISDALPCSVEELPRLRSFYGAYDPALPLETISQATSANFGYNSAQPLTVVSSVGNLITVAQSIPPNFLPGYAKMWITGSSDSNSNTNFFIIDHPTPTTFHVGRAATTVSCSGGCASHNGGTILFANGNSFPLYGIQADGGANPTGSGSTVLDYSTTTACAGVGNTSFLRNRGQYFTISGVTGTDASYFNSLTGWYASDNLALPTDGNGTTSSCQNYWREVPNLNGTGGTANIVLDGNFMPGREAYNAGSPNTDPGQTFLSIVGAMLGRAAGTRLYNISNNPAAYNPTASGAPQNKGGWIQTFYAGEFGQTTINNQLYAHPSVENGYSVPEFWAASTADRMWSRLGKYYLGATALNAIDYGSLMESATFQSASGYLHIIANFSNGTQTRTITLTPLETSGQNIILWIADATHGIYPLTIITAGTSTYSLTLAAGQAAYFLFPKTFAGELNLPTVGFRLADVADATSIAARCGYDQYLMPAAVPMNLGSGDSGFLTVQLLMDKNIGPVYCKLSYLGLSNQVLGGGAKSALLTF